MTSKLNNDLCCVKHCEVSMNKIELWISVHENDWIENAEKIRNILLKSDQAHYYAWRLLRLLRPLPLDGHPFGYLASTFTRTFPKGIPTPSVSVSSRFDPTGMHCDAWKWGDRSIFKPLALGVGAA